MKRGSLLSKGLTTVDDSDYQYDDFARGTKACTLRTAYFVQRGPQRFNIALMLSLLAHTLLLSIAFGGQTSGLPGLNFPWKERRLGADELHILIAPVPIMEAASALAPPTATEMTKAVLDPVATPTIASDATPVTKSPTVAQKEAAAILRSPSPPSAVAVAAPATEPAPPTEPAATAREQAAVNLPIAPDAPQVRPRATSVAQNTLASESGLPAPTKAGETTQKQVGQVTQERALEQVRLEHERQTAERLKQAILTTAAQEEASRQEQSRQDAARAEQIAKNESARMELERLELARQEGLRREELQRERARQEELARQAARMEQERTETARLETQRREAIQQEQAQLEATRQDVLKQEAARRNAAKQEEAKQEALKREAARQDALKQEAAQQDALKQDAARQERTKQEPTQRERAEQEAKREERVRAIGKQLSEDAARRLAVLNHPSHPLPLTVSSLRRGRLFGRADHNTDLVLYAEAMSKKIEMNMTFDMVREAVKQPHSRPTVTVAVRADGSVEKVTFEVSSGVVAIDEAVRKVIASQAPYGAFPPALARQYDVIEIRRTWIFDMAIRLQ